MRNAFSSVEQGIEAIAQGLIVIVVDSEEREDEGDFVAAAELVTPWMIHFMISQGRGQLCMPVSTEIAERLALKRMPTNCAGIEQPRFAIPVDYRTCKSGISPMERASTVRAMVDPTTGPDDFIRPGHIFPLVAEPGGLLVRQGHTEASVELARLAGLAPAALLCEICSNDGLHTADRTELIAIAKEFSLHMLTIDDIIAYNEQHSQERNGVKRNGHGASIVPSPLSLDA